MPSKAERTVLAFMDSWKRLDVDGVLAQVTENATFQPDPRAAVIRGQHALDAAWRGDAQRMSTYDYEVVAIASSDTTVFLERLERVTTPDGRYMELPIVGVFEVNQDARITAWRDYWDIAMVPKSNAH